MNIVAKKKKLVRVKKRKKKIEIEKPSERLFEKE